MPTSVAGWQRNWARKCRTNSTSPRGWPAAPLMTGSDWRMVTLQWSGPGIVGPYAKGHTDHENTQPGGQGTVKDPRLLRSSTSIFTDSMIQRTSKDNFLEPPSGCYPAATPMLPPNLGCWGTLGNCSTSKKSWETTRLQPNNQSGERMLEDCNQPSTCAMVWCQSPQDFWSARFQAGKTRSWDGALDLRPMGKNATESWDWTG